MLLFVASVCTSDKTFGGKEERGGEAHGKWWGGAQGLMMHENYKCFISKYIFTHNNKKWRAPEAVEVTNTTLSRKSEKTH